MSNLTEKRPGALDRGWRHRKRYLPMNLERWKNFTKEEIKIIEGALSTCDNKYRLTDEAELIFEEFDALAKLDTQ